MTRVAAAELRATPPDSQIWRRLDIQGLRAIAVLMVIAFHAGLPVPGGFVGVDVFFVISGFVITAMLHREWLLTGRISFTQFYLRRFKRLAPALALVVSVSVVISAFVLLPLGAQQTAAMTGIGAVFMVANFVIAQTTGAYFDAPAEENPLLNTWSLSVEEQFYLVLPVLLALGWLLASRGKKLNFIPFLLVGGLAFLSLGALIPPAVPALEPDFISSLLGGHGALFGFYSPLTRVWEFAVGSLLALVLHRWTPRASLLMAVLGVIGFVMLTGSLWLINESTTFPGPWTLLPVCGTLLLLLSGVEVRSPTCRLLSIPPMVRIGDWSYSLYLWHWPFIVFAVYLLPFESFAPPFAALIAALPALASYKWIEQPIRQASVSGLIKVSSLACIVLIPPIMISAIVWSTASLYWAPKYQSGEVPGQFKANTSWTQFYMDLENEYFPCTNNKIRDNALVWEGITRCRQSKQSSGIDVAIVGDSHAEHLFVGFAESFPNKNIAFYIHDVAPVEDGGAMTEIISQVSSDQTISTVIVNAFWGQKLVPEDDLISVLEKFTESGKFTFVLDDVPSFPFPAEQCNSGKSPWVPLSNCQQESSGFELSYREYLPALEGSVRAVEGAELLSSTGYFCRDGYCDMVQDDQLLYRDSHHLNEDGSRYLVSKILEDFPKLRKAIDTN